MMEIAERLDDSKLELQLIFICGGTGRKTVTNSLPNWFLPRWIAAAKRKNNSITTKYARLLIGIPGERSRLMLVCDPARRHPRCYWNRDRPTVLCSAVPVVHHRPCVVQLDEGSYHCDGWRRSEREGWPGAEEFKSLTLPI